MQPFTKEYYERERDSMTLTEQRWRNVHIDIFNYKFKVYDGYMYTERDLKLNDVPVLSTKGSTWMSLTPMEIDSHYLPIQFAKGIVGVAGLGLGYYVQRILDKPEVEQVIVYELNQEIISLYMKLFGRHPKLKIEKQNALVIRDKKFDFFYCDIYPNSLDRDTIWDMTKIIRKNEIGLYHFWTQEWVTYELLLNGYKVPKDWLDRFVEFYVMFDEALEANPKRKRIFLSEDMSEYFNEKLEKLYYHNMELVNSSEINKK